MLKKTVADEKFLKCVKDCKCPPADAKEHKHSEGMSVAWLKAVRDNPENPKWPPTENTKEGNN